MASRYGVSVRPSYRIVYPESGGFESVADGGAVSYAETADRPQALAAIELAMTPAPPEEITKALTVLRALTRTRASAAEDIDFEFGVMEQQLGRYPADVVMTVLRTQAERSPWFPAWSELFPRLERLVSARRWMRQQLEPARSQDIGGLIGGLLDAMAGKTGDAA